MYKAAIYSLPLYLTLSNPMDCSPTSLLCPWDSPGKNPGVGCLCICICMFMGFPGGANVKEPSCQCKG